MPHLPPHTCVLAYIGYGVQVYVFKSSRETIVKRRRCTAKNQQFKRFHSRLMYRDVKCPFLYFKEDRAEISLRRAYLGRLQRFGWSGQSRWQVVPETLLSSPGGYGGRRKEEEKLSAAVREGISACASPTFSSWHTAAEQKAGPWGPRLLLSLPSTPPRISRGSALGVSGFDERHPHTLLLSNNGALSSPPPRAGVPCVRFVFRQRVS